MRLTRGLLLVHGQTILLCAILLAACTPSHPAGPPDAPATLKSGQTVPPNTFYQALRQRENGAPNVISILQIGDSHTQGDAFAQRMRNLFQTRFGNAGRGLQPPNIPPGPHSSGWTLFTSRYERSPFGMTGQRLHTEEAANLTLPPAALLQVEYLGQPHGGHLTLQAGDNPPVTIGTAGPTGWLSISAPTSPITLRTTGDGPVDILGWTTTTGVPGVMYSNLGTIGATASVMGRWDTGIMRDELTHLSPALIIVAFGTNEGFNDHVDPAEYGRAFTQKLRDLQAMAPAATLVVAGPPDAQRRNRRSRACGEKGWQIPPKLAAIRNAQRQVASRLGLAFWDWQAAMGGPCAARYWAIARPRLEQPDRIHQTDQGYQRSADALFQLIMDGYTNATWR
jgi:lysophospholipase L1-like esterase